MEPAFQRGDLLFLTNYEDEEIRVSYCCCPQWKHGTSFPKRRPPVPYQLRRRGDPSLLLLLSSVEAWNQLSKEETSCSLPTTKTRRSALEKLLSSKLRDETFQ